MSGDNLAAIDLAKSFTEASEIIDELNQTDLAINSNQYQDKVKKSISLLEHSTLLVNELSLFSSNETIDDIATSSLEYLLLPAFLGILYTKVTIKDRLECLEISEVYFKDFLKRAKSYELEVDLELDENSDDDEEETRVAERQPTLESMAIDRNKKIAKFKKRKQLESELDEMKKLIKLTKDEEVVRKYHLVTISNWIETCIDELQSLKREKPILIEMRKSKTGFHKPIVEKKAPAFKPFIITRNEIQKKVYGLGYPSIPTMTIDQFINKKLEEGSLSITEPGNQNCLLDWAKDPDKKRLEDEKEAKQKEENIEKDDLETLKKARDWDDFKDVHKRGSGNRKNMG